MPGSDSASLTVRRLNQYRPFERGGASAREAQEDLFLAALAEAGGAIASVAEASETVATLFGIKLDDVETAHAINELVKQERVLRAPGGFVLAPEERARLELVAAESEACAGKAVAGWREYLVEQWPGLTPAEMDCLEDDLRVFLQFVVARHGAEATLALYPDDPEAERRYAELEEAGFAVLGQTESTLEDIRGGALSHFVRRPTEAQRAYLAQMLNTGYFMSVLSIDQHGARLVREIVSGQRVYIDTNFVFRVLGVQGPRHVRPARTILQRTKEAGYQVCVTPWTVEEFRNSLERAKDYLHKYPVAAPEYAELLAEATSDEDFVTAYWRQVRDVPVQINDFFAHWAEVELHLQELGIDVVAEGCTAVDQRTDEVTDQLAVLAKALHGRYRHPALIEHDVKHRMLVQRLRGTANRSFATAGYWFLTFDSVLPRFDFQARREDGSRLTFCVTAGSWFQIIEAFRPKTDDEGQALADLLASPYVRYRRTLSKDKAQAVVARMRLHEGGSPELAARIMMNSALVGEIQESSDEAETETIDNAIVSAAKQAQEAARRAQELAAQEREHAEAERRVAAQEVRQAEERLAREQRDADAREAEALRGAEERRVRAIDGEKARSETELREAQREHDAKMRTLAGQVEELQEDRDRARRRVRTLIAMLVLTVIAVVGLLAVGLETWWAVVLVVAAVLGLAAAIDQLWISRPTR